MKNVIFIAPPAAGKGTFSDYLEKKYNYIHVSTGDLFREKIKDGTKEAQELDEILKSGQLVDDERTFKLLKDKLITLRSSENFIIEGLPRTLQQAKVLDIILQDLNFKDYVVIYISIDSEILKKRMTGRRICADCGKTYNIYFEQFKPQKENYCDECSSNLIQRKDDNDESFKVRYGIFERNFEPIMSYYQEQNHLKTIDNSNENHTEALKELERIVGASID